MRTVAVTKIGSLRDPDESTRGRVGVVDFPEQPLGPEDVRIRVAYAAICGSDPHLAEGFFGTDVPIGLGHELSGVVEALGERAIRNGLRVGDRVAGNFLRFCGTCRPCQEGRQQFCENIQEYNRPGMAETVTWHESQVYKLPDSVSLLKGCLLEPTSVAVRIADKTSIKVGDRVAICGGGPIGQLALQVLKMHGATSLTLIEPIADRREMGLRHGAEHVIDPVAEDQRARADAITGGRGYDVVVDASGSPRAVRGLLDIAAKGGTVVYGAMYPETFEMPLNLSDYLYLKELTLTGVFVSPYAFPRALQILPHLDVDELTRAVFPLESAVEAFEAHVSGEHPKVVIRCNELEAVSS
ncbi:zinc-dependent alcohol dehydrogenase [Microbacterium immunditiarum]|uniref:(R,R)-butanediol dehydrogenase/meso-butanediol dehydrogenase/diacetyl reductase/L-iditol 2-dehydrogenase n=1 Tax=Microbacterium immunditiarum TaxID=337480 RepID=A0A7Y9KI18_9MICO|nr:alcohol dehydrogenase catalytic domain-containing protein [Microbacterium immunditiarum]NYE18295.1 (R,R)-butanediol dehydrogenase/meso-butanediol dehydrogenase/diacetyl reductase/L-iditol 2-dehydrogenase [Microbacterium immunditiarum]